MAYADVCAYPLQFTPDITSPNITHHTLAAPPVSQQLMVNLGQAPLGLAIPPMNAGDLDAADDEDAWEWD